MFQQLKCVFCLLTVAVTLAQLMGKYRVEPFEGYIALKQVQLGLW